MRGDKAHSVAGMSEKNKKIVPKLFEQTTYINLVKGKAIPVLS
jgi:hypothetical protein